MAFDRHRKTTLTAPVSPRRPKERATDRAATRVGSQGEHIARIGGSGLMPGVIAVQNPTRGVRPSGRASRPPIETQKRRYASLGNRQRAQAHVRRQAEGFAKADDQGPWKGKTQGSIRRCVGLNTRHCREELSRGSTRKLSFRPADRGNLGSHGGGSAATARGAKFGSNVDQPRARRRLRRENPKGAAGMKQGWQGRRGRKPSRG